MIIESRIYELVDLGVDEETHPWACTVPRWWHWRWKCASPRRSVRWQRQPTGASRGASVAVTARWQNTQAGLVHCSRQKTWNNRGGQEASSSTHSSSDHHGITWMGLKWITIMNLSDRSYFSLLLQLTVGHTKGSIPVLPASDKVGVFHQIAVNVFHMVTGTAHEEVSWRQRKSC